MQSVWCADNTANELLNFFLRRRLRQELNCEHEHNYAPALYQIFTPLN